MRDNRFRAPAAIALLFLTGGVAACSDGGSEAGTTAISSSSSSGAGGSGGDAGSGGSGGSGGAGGSGVDCPPGTHDDGSGSCVTTISSWTPAPLLLKGRDHHATFVATTKAGSFLYVAGGTTGSSLLNGLEQAAIAQDGSLGDFAAAGTLPRQVAGTGLAQIDNAILLAGGLGIEGGQAASITDTILGSIADDGAVSFTAGPPLLSSRYHLTLSADRGFVYAVGGLEQTYVNGMTSQKFSNAVERASWDGATLSDFTALAPLPDPLTHHAAVVRDHAIYLIGGIAGSSAARATILRAAVDDAGDLGPWDPAGDLPEGRATSAAFVHLDQLYVVAGATAAQGGEVATVLRAPFLADGKIGAFEELTPLPKERAHAHHAPLLGTTLYSAGGSIDHKVQKDVFFATIK